MDREKALDVALILGGAAMIGALIYGSKKAEAQASPAPSKPALACDEIVKTAYFSDGPVYNGLYLIYFKDYTGWENEPVTCCMVYPDEGTVHFLAVTGPYSGAECSVRAPPDLISYYQSTCSQLGTC